MTTYYLVETGGCNTLTGDRGRIVARGSLQDMRDSRAEERLANRFGQFEVIRGGPIISRLIGGELVRESEC